MQIYIDSNVYLGFYAFSEDSISELQKLIPMLKDESLSLLLPSQTVDEVRRNRDVKVADAIKDVLAFKAKVNLPNAIRELDESKEFRDSLKDASEKLKKLRDKISEIEAEKSFKADELIEAIFKQVKVIDSSKVHEKACLRFQKGQPPGKSNKTYGDEINWESLLDGGEDGDLFIISNDKDFYSPLGENRLHSSLEKEWKDTKKGNVKAYRTISAFFKARDIKIKFANDQQRKELVSSLPSSGNFSFTHSLISQLNEYATFEMSEIAMLVSAVLNNSQVGWILSDADLFEFYGSLKSSIEAADTLSDGEKAVYFEKYQAAKSEREKFLAEGV